MSKVVILDAGHGGIDSGAIGFGYYESHIVLDIAKMVKGLLESKGVKVVMTRETDDFISLQERAVIDHQYNADCFVSIHNNAADTAGKAHGMSVFNFKNLGNSYKVSKAIHDSIIDAGLYTADRGLRDGSGLYVIRKTKAPACLCELAFIDNAVDNEMLRTKKPQFAMAVAKGILSFLELDTNLDAPADGNASVPVPAPTGLLPNGSIQKDAVVTTEVLNVRAGRGTNTEVIGSLHKGDKINLWYCANGWASFSFNNRTAYVYTKYTSLV